MLPVRLPWKTLRHDICRHFRCRQIGRSNDIALAGVSDEMVSHAYMLGSLVKLRVLRKLDSALVVGEDFLWIGIQAE